MQNIDDFIFWREDDIINLTYIKCEYWRYLKLEDKIKIEYLLNFIKSKLKISPIIRLTSSDLDICIKLSYKMC